ncbi:MAG TPA: DUF1992 domain-containing protein [Desulfobulbaceae bacterium]|nr:DUF1992 domain-containing protein [Desulfobulbaceae bacterium]
MLTTLHKIAERKIEKAIAEGKVPDLSHWKNKPLPEDNMQNVPTDLRLAYRMLKNSGYIPEELALRKEIVRTEELLAAAVDEQEKYKQLKKLNYLKFKLECRRGRPLHINEDSPYFGKVVDRVR